MERETPDFNEESTWPEADPSQQAALIAIGAATLLCGGYAVRRHRPGLFPLWLAGLVVWGTLCKYLICTRCERFGQACDFCYGGRYAALFFRRQPGKTLDTAGIISEGGSISVLQVMPLFAAWKSKRLFLFYLGLVLGWQAMLLKFCCVKCVAYSRDPWKREFCPSYRLARLILGPPETDQS